MRCDTLGVPGVGIQLTKSVVTRSCVFALAGILAGFCCTNVTWVWNGNCGLLSYFFQLFSEIEEIADNSLCLSPGCMTLS